MHIYKERIFEQEQQARRFSYRTKGHVIFTQQLDAADNCRAVWVVRYIPKQEEAGA